ncbi:MAG: hypothetical protein IJ966_05270 [Bacilli bacterium]|nr:hypothetical protein [Bacilli bacterium]
MEKISKGIVFSEDIKRILNGVNAFDYSYDIKLCDDVIKGLREDFKIKANKIFDGNAVFITEEEMLRVNNLMVGEYPHRYIR